MRHTDFFALTRAIKAKEYKELYTAIKLHGDIYEWDLADTEHPVIAVNTGGFTPVPTDVEIYKVYIQDGILKLCGIEKEYGEDIEFQPEEVFTGHLSFIIDCLPPANGVEDVTTEQTGIYQ